MAHGHLPSSQNVDLDHERASNVCTSVWLTVPPKMVVEFEVHVSHQRVSDPFSVTFVQKPPILPFVWLKGGFLLYHCGYRQFFMWLTWPTQPKKQHRLSSFKHAATRTRTTQKVMEARRTPRTQPRKHSLAQEYLGVDANKLEHSDITTEVLVACGQEIFRHSKYEEQDWLRDNLSYLQGWQTRVSYR